MSQVFLNFQTLSEFDSSYLEVLVDFDSLSERQKFARDLLDLFKSNAVTSMARLEKLSVESNWNDLAREAHKFKSGCYAMGSERMGKLCAEVEATAKKQENPEYVLQCLKAMRETLPGLYEKIETYIAQMK